MSILALVHTFSCRFDALSPGMSFPRRHDFLKNVKASHFSITSHTFGAFHTGLAWGSARIQSRAWAEPLVGTSCSSDEKFQACTENLSWTLFTLKAQLRLGSDSAQDYRRTVFIKLTPETVKCLTSTLDTDPPFKGPSVKWPIMISRGSVQRKEKNANRLK